MDRQATVTLDAEHRYWIGARRIPGVTEVLEANHFYEWPWVSPQDLFYKRALGAAVHRAAELYDRGTLDWKTISEECGAYLGGWVKLRSDHPQMVLVAVEQRLYHAPLDFAGTLDRVFRFRPEAPVTLGDIKIGEEYPAARLQTAAYYGAYNSGRTWGERAANRCSIHLKGDGSYKIVVHDSEHDFAAFAACLKLYHWKKGLKNGRTT